MVSLKDRKWKEFYISQIFSHVTNSRAYHKDKLKIDYSNKGIAYITRTNKNNGLEEIVNKAKLENLPNSKNTLSLGAENATFFFQPYDYITGNKMYVLESKNINKQIGLFLQLVLNSSIRGCGFGFATGLTGSRAKNRQFLLPINNEGDPDWNFMENYVKQIEDTQKEEYKAFALKKLQNLEYKEIPPLKEKQWKAFEIKSFFEIYTGGDMIISKLKSGNIPLITHSLSENGVTKYIENQGPKIKKFDCNTTISLADRGNFGAFVQMVDFYIGTRVKALEFKVHNVKINKETLLFFANSINAQAKKFNYGNNCCANIGKLKIMLPIKSDETPDYEYMEQYIKNIMYKQLSSYLSSCE